MYIPHIINLFVQNILLKKPEYQSEVYTEIPHIVAQLFLTVYVEFLVHQISHHPSLNQLYNYVHY